MPALIKPIPGDTILTRSGMGVIFSLYDGTVLYAKTYADRKNPLEGDLSLLAPLTKRESPYSHVVWALKGKRIKFSVSCKTKYGLVDLGKTVALSPGKAASNILHRLGGQHTNVDNLKLAKGVEHIMDVTGASEYRSDLLTVKIVGYI